MPGEEDCDTEVPRLEHLFHDSPIWRFLVCRVPIRLAERGWRVSRRMGRQHSSQTKNEYFKLLLKAERLTCFYNVYVFISTLKTPPAINKNANT